MFVQGQPGEQPLSQAHLMRKGMWQKKSRERLGESMSLQAWNIHFLVPAFGIPINLTSVLSSLSETRPFSMILKVYPNLYIL